MSVWTLLLVIAVIAVVLLGLSLIIIVMKAVRGWRQARRRRWREKLEPGIRRYAGSLEGEIGNFVEIPGAGVGRAAAIAIFLDLAEILKGDARDRITDALEKIGMVDHEIQMLKARSWWRRSAAADQLGLARSSRAISALAECMNDPVAEVRLRAARALGNIKGLLAIKPLVGALKEPNRWSTLRVADILASMGKDAGNEVIDAFPELPRSGKLAVIDILGRLRQPDTAVFLEQRLKDEDPDIRARAAHALGQLGDPSLSRSLVEALRDPEWPVRAMAAKGLGRMRAPSALDPLGSALDDQEWWVRTNAAAALRELGEPGYQTLLGVLDSTDTYARHKAVEMLEESGVIDRYVDLLREDGPNNALARQFVATLVSMRRIERLEELSRTHDDPALRATLSELLSERVTGTPGGAPGGAS